MEGKRPRTTNTVLKKENKIVLAPTVLDFKTYYKVTSNQESVVLVKEQTNQWKRIESSNRLIKYSQVIFNKKAKAIQ